MKRGRIGKCMVAGVLTLSMALTSGAMAVGDGQPSSWAAAEVERAREAGLLDFEPHSGYQEDITRGEFAGLAVLLAKSLGCPVEELGQDSWQGTPFTDLTAGTEGVYSAAAWRLGLMNGVSDTTFAPDRTITRTEICVLLDRVMDVCGVELPQTVDGVAERMASGAEGAIPGWAAEGVKNLIGSGLMKGSGDGWQLSAHTTVEQAALLAVRAMDAGCADLEAKRFTAAEREQIAKLKELRATFGNPGEPYAQAPSVEEFIPGKLNDAFLQDALNALNYVRAVAGLEPVGMRDEKNQEVQLGALLLAAGGDEAFSTEPSKPKGMSEDLYRRGSQVAKESMSGREQRDLTEYVLNRVEDYSILFMGSGRRWLLDPLLTTVGMGYIDGYSVIQVGNGTSGEWDGPDYVTWPSAGVFPEELFHDKLGWSCLLKPGVYVNDMEDMDGVAVTVTDGSGNTWTDQVAEDKESADGAIHINLNDGYVRLNPSYGGTLMVVFHPVGLEYRTGEPITVTISGLKLRSGGTDTITYTVKLF